MTEGEHMTIEQAVRKAKQGDIVIVEEELGLMNAYIIRDGQQMGRALRVAKLTKDFFEKLTKRPHIIVLMGPDTYSIIPNDSCAECG